MKTYKLSELGTIITGNTPSTKVKEYYDSNDIKFIKPNDIPSGTNMYLDQSNNYISEKAREKARLVPMNSVLVTCIGVIGKVSVTKEEVAFNQQINAIVPNEKVLPEYLALKLKYKKNSLEQLSNKSIVSNINKTNFSKFEIRIPSIKEQEKFLEVIKRNITIIDKRQQQIEALSALKQTLFLNLYSNNEVETESIKLSELILSSRNGLSRRGNDLDGEIVLKLKDIRENDIDFTEVNRITLTEKELNTYKLNDQDLLLVRVNGNPDYVGRCALFEEYKEDVYFNDHIIRLEINNSINKYFLAYYLNSRYGLNEFRKQIKTSAGQYTISRKGLDDIEIMYPNLNIQDELISQFNEIDKINSSLLNSLKVLEELFQTILQQAFNGELFKEDIKV